MLFELGQEVTWLGQMLPAIARGDMDPFFNTGYELRNYKRQQMTVAWPMMQQLCTMMGAECLQMLQSVLPGVRQWVDQVALGVNYPMIMLAVQQ